MKKATRYVYLTIAVAFAVMFFLYALRAAPRNYSDFRVYHATAQTFAQKGDIYTHSSDPSITEYKYSPFFAFLVSPLSFFSLGQAALIFFTLNFIFLLALSIFSKKLIVEKELSFKESLLLYGAPLIFSYRFILGVLHSGQVSIVMIALVVMTFYFIEKKKDVLAGALLGLSIMIKYTPAIVLPYLLVRKKWKAAGFTCLFVAFYCFIPAVYVGIGRQVAYLKSWLPYIVQTSLDKGSLFDSKNQSLYSMLFRFLAEGTHFGDKIRIAALTFDQVMAAGVLVCAVIYLLILWPVPGRKKDQKKLDVPDYALLILGISLFNPNAWTFNYITTLVAAMVVVYYLIKNNFKDKLTLGFFSLAFLLANFGSRSIVGKPLSAWADTLSLVTMSALILLFILFKLKFRAERDL